MSLSSINWIDVALGGAVVISMIVGVSRGLIREVLSLIAWALSIWVAYRFSQDVSKTIQQFIQDEQISYLAAFGGLFLVTLFAIGMLNLLIGMLLNLTKLSGTDRLLGVIFGFLRGIIIAALLVFVGRFIPDLTESQMWKNASFVRPFSGLANWGINRLPANIKSIVDGTQKAATAPVVVEAVGNTQAGRIIPQQEAHMPQSQGQVHAVELESYQTQAQSAQPVQQAPAAQNTQQVPQQTPAATVTTPSQQPSVGAVQTQENAVSNDAAQTNNTQIRITNEQGGVAVISTPEQGASTMQAQNPESASTQASGNDEPVVIILESTTEE